MTATTVPVKTPEGQAELSHRRLKLGQRQRTLLLLVDGKRSEAEVRRMAAAAGVPDTCFDELCGLGLIAVPVAAVVLAVIPAVVPAAMPAAVPAPVAAVVPLVAEPEVPAIAQAADDALAPAPEIEAIVEVPAPPAASPVVDETAATDMASEASAAIDDDAAPGPVPSTTAVEAALPATSADAAATDDPEHDPELQAMIDAPDVEALAVLLDRRSEERVPVAQAVAAAIAAVPQLDHGPDSVAGESLLPAAQTLQPEAENSGWKEAVSLIRPSQLTEFDEADPSLEEARELLVRAVRAAAPVAGSLTTIRLRRARSRADLANLLGEVEARIVRPPRELAAQQTLRRVRLLLDVPHDSLLPVLGT